MARLLWGELKLKDQNFTITAQNTIFQNLRDTTPHTTRKVGRPFVGHKYMVIATPCSSRVSFDSWFGQSNNVVHRINYQSEVSFWHASLSGGMIHDSQKCGICQPAKVKRVVLFLLTLPHTPLINPVCSSSVPPERSFSQNLRFFVVQRTSIIRIVWFYSDHFTQKRH